jgi:O-antigen/teichoic acid export membrane protein
VLQIAETVSQPSKEIAKGSLWTLGGNAFYKIISFLYVILIARMASESEVGLFYLSLAIMQGIGVVAHLGIPSSLQRFVPFFEARGEFGKIRQILKLCYSVILVSAAVFFIAIWLSSDFIASLYNSAPLAEALRYFSVYVLLFGISVLQITYLQGRADMRGMQFVSNLQNILKLILTLALFFVIGPLAISMILGLLGALLLSSLAAAFVVWKKTSDLPESKDALTKKEILHDIVPLGMTISIISSISILLSSTDKILLGYLLPDSLAIVGIYGVATTFALMLMIFPMSLGQIFMPIISRLVGKNDLEQIRETTGTSLRWSLIVTLPVASVLVVFSSEILSVIYGSGYGAGGPAMAIFVIGIAARSFTYIVTFVIAAMRKIRAELIMAVSAAAFNVVLSALLIPLAGMEGAAFASLMSFIFYFLLLRHYAKKLFSFTFPGQAYLLLFAGAFSFIVLALLSTQLTGISFPDDFKGQILFLVFLGAMTALSAAIFLGFAILLKCFTKEDRTLLNSLLRKFKVPEPLPSLASRAISFGIADK